MNLGPMGLGNNVAGIVVIMLIFAFFAVIAIGSGFLIYAAKQLKKHEDAGAKTD